MDLPLLMLFWICRLQPLLHGECECVNVSECVTNFSRTTETEMEVKIV